VSPSRIVIKKRTVFLIALVTLALGLIGTSLSTLYKQIEIVPDGGPLATLKTSYGFPLGWYGYVYKEGGVMPLIPPPPTYWFSLESLLLDAAFWFATGFFAWVATLQSFKILLRTIGSKIVASYFLASAYFSVAGLFLFLFSYGGLGLRLYGIGMFLVGCTFYQSLVGEGRTSQRLFRAHTSSNST
jgi:hypothetical protein